MRFGTFGLASVAVGRSAIAETKKIVESVWSIAKESGCLTFKCFLLSLLLLFCLKPLPDHLNQMPNISIGVFSLLTNSTLSSWCHSTYCRYSPIYLTITF